MKLLHDTGLALTVWGGAQITPTRIVLAIALELFIVGYVVWAVRYIGR